MNLVERVKAIIMTPKTEWPVIANEPGDAGYLFPNYVAILAAIPAVCGFIGMVVFGISLPVIGTIRVGFFAGLLWAVAQYLLSLVMVYVTALIIDALAPTFSGQKNFSGALKLAAYSATPFWLAGIFSLIPAVSFLGILGLYAFYLLWTGLPVLMKSPPEKSLGYVAATAVAVIIIGIILTYVLRRLIGLPF